MSSFSLTRQVEFRDTDAAGIMHFSVFFTFMEEAEHAFLRTLGLNIVLHDDEGEFSFPRVAASCDYRAPLRFEDEVEISVYISRVGEKSVTYQFQFSRGAVDIAQGQMTAVCCRIAPDGAVRSIPIPAWVAETLRAAVV